MSIAQDSTGKVHALMGANDYSLSGGRYLEYYVRFKLNYDASKRLSGFNLEAVIPLPDHRRISNVLSDLRGEIRVISYSGSESLMYVVNVTTVSGSSTQDIKVFVGRASTLSPASTSDFVDLAGATGDSKVLDSCTYNMPSGGSYCTASPAFFSTHNVTSTFAQNRSTNDIYVFIGPIEADYGVANDPSGQPESARLRYIRLVWNGSAWIAATPVVIATDNGSYLPLLFNAQSGANYAWLMYLHPDNGIVFGRVDANGYSTVTTPLNAKNHNGWGAFTVAPDDSKLWAIWNISVINGANPQTAEAYWDGKSWNVYSDTGVTTGDNSGIGGVAGWNNGVAAILFRGTLLRSNPPIPEAAAIWGQ